ncbi:MAG TPA: NAD(P)H-binding protein [Solirubrobacteraceae bacterium]|jgi:uncharacterized protein YbjT (DUF2867 family)|nr:NAD(P)H-binding protein [Solirubrobacteraceae bacterium]
MRILVTGASGFVGSLLVPRLRQDGHAVRALGRDLERLRAALGQEDVELVRADAHTDYGLEQALEGVEVAYYLIHSMERIAIERGAATGSPEDDRAFPERERVAVENFATAATRAGVRRVVYLGGLMPRRDAGTTVSRHLASRAHVEQVLLDAVPDSLALRASIVIGARSRSFRLLVHLVERMPVLTLPAWQSLRTQPIDARDMIEMLAACATAQLPRRSLDVGGPEVLAYGEMLERIAELMLVNRPALNLGVNLTGVTARVAAAIAGEDPELVVPLMEGLQADLLPAEHHAAELLGVRLHSFDSAVEHALAEWERSEPLAAR